jgi:hypothetical protein
VDFDTKCKVLSECWLQVQEVKDSPNLVALAESGNLIFPLAYGWIEGYIEELSLMGINDIENFYNVVLECFMLEPDTEFDSFDDLVSANLARYGSKE